MDRFEILVIFREVRQVAQKAVIKRFLLKRRFPSVLQKLSKLFWGALEGKAAIPAAELQRGRQQQQSISVGCVYTR